MSFADTIALNRTAELVPTASRRITYGVSELEVRERGCFITAANLLSPSTGQVLPLLYSEAVGAQATKAKLRASHGMSPAGKSDGLGGQHGAGRWADFAVVSSGEDENGAWLAMQAKRSDDGRTIARAFELTDNTLTITNLIRNESESLEPDASLGDHLYFACPEQDIRGIRINDQSFAEYVGSNGSARAVLEGEARIRPNQSEPLLIEFPDGRKVRMSIRVLHQVPGDEHGERTNFSIWVWHAKDTDSICFEPVVDVFGAASDSPSHLPLHGYATKKLITTLEML